VGDARRRSPGTTGREAPRTNLLGWLDEMAAAKSTRCTAALVIVHYRSPASIQHGQVTATSVLVEAPSLETELPPSFVTQTREPSEASHSVDR